MSRNKAVFNWSGGKDSSLTLYHVLREKEFDVKYLLTSCSREFDRISMHGVRVSLLKRQAEAIGIPLKIIYVPIMPTMEAYDAAMGQVLTELKNEGIEYSIFGDIFLEDLRKYREERLAEAGLKGVFPIWKRPTDQLAREFIDLGFKSILVCTDEKYMDESFCGRMIDEQLLKDLPPGVDPCGERGEFHSFVFDGPIFKEALDVTLGEKVRRTYAAPKNSDGRMDQINCKTAEAAFWYIDLMEGGQK